MGVSMFIRAYLRASTVEQDAERARELLIGFAAEHGHQIASFYVENESGATLDRPELMRLIRDAADRDIVLVGDDREFGKNRTLSFASSCNQFIVFSMDERKWRKLFDKQIGIL